MFIKCNCSILDQPVGCTNGPGSLGWKSWKPKHATLNLTIYMRTTTTLGVPWHLLEYISYNLS